MHLAVVLFGLAFNHGVGALSISHGKSVLPLFADRMKARVRASPKMQKGDADVVERAGACLHLCLLPLVEHATHTSLSIPGQPAAATVYLLPLLDGFPFGAFIYSSVPAVGSVAYQLVPFVNAFQSLPFAGLILFVGLSYFTRNQGLSRFVRFNIQQALLLDILLIIPGVFGGASRMFPVELQIIGSNFVFYLMALIVAYSWAQVAQGKTPDQVPILSEAANMQIGPF